MDDAMISGRAMMALEAGKKTLAERGLVVISVEKLENLEEDSNFLSALQVAGVDNWSGYDEAQLIYQEEYLDG